MKAMLALMVAALTSPAFAAEGINATLGCRFDDGDQSVLITFAPVAEAMVMETAIVTGPKGTELNLANAEVKTLDYMFNKKNSILAVFDLADVTRTREGDRLPTTRIELVPAFSLTWVPEQKKVWRLMAYRTLFGKYHVPKDGVDCKEAR